MRLENALRQIQSDCANFHHGNLPSSGSQTPQLWHTHAVEGASTHHWKTTICFAGLQLDEITAPFALDGPINGIAFETYMEKVLIPELKPGVVVVTDNLSSYKGPPSPQ